VAAEGAAGQAAGQAGAAARVAAEVCGKLANPARRPAVEQAADRAVDWAAERVRVFLAAEATARAVAVDPGAAEAESAAAADRVVVPGVADLAVAEPEGERAEELAAGRAQAANRASGWRPQRC